MNSKSLCQTKYFVTENEYQLKSRVCQKDLTHLKV